MLRRIHLAVGILAVVVFLLTGQVMRFHHPSMEQLPAEVRMMYVSRHIYLLGTALVNVVLGLYLHLQATSWRRLLQEVGSLLILLSPLLLTLAFFSEPALGLLGRSWRGYYGMLALFVGAMAHLVASAGAPRIDTPT